METKAMSIQPEAANSKTFAELCDSLPEVDFDELIADFKEDFPRFRGRGVGLKGEDRCIEVIKFLARIERPAIRAEIRRAVRFTPSFSRLSENSLGKTLDRILKILKAMGYVKEFKSRLDKGYYLTKRVKFKSNEEKINYSLTEELHKLKDEIQKIQKTLKKEGERNTEIFEKITSIQKLLNKKLRYY